GLGNQHGGVALGEQHLAARLVGLLDPAASHVDPLARVFLLLLGQRAERALGQRQRSLAAQMVGLGDRERVQIGSRGESLLGFGGGRGQRLFAEIHGRSRGITLVGPALDSGAVVGHDGSSLPLGSVRAGSAPGPDCCWYEILWDRFPAIHPDYRRTGSEPRARWRTRALAYRQIAAAAARFRLSARPWMGMRTRWSASAATAGSRPCASLPNSQATGPARMSSASSRSTSPSAAVASRVRPASRTAVSVGSISRPRAIGTWNKLPALARTHLPLCGSTVDPARTTPSAPTASATRIRVPALPGSAISAGTASRRGSPPSTSASGTSICSHTATSPGAVTVSPRCSAARSSTRVARTPRAATEATSSCSRSAAAAE